MELCFMSNLSTADWAAWVQAIGSIGAIVGTALTTRYQVRKQHTLTLESEKRQSLDRQTASLERLLRLSANAASRYERSLMKSGIAFQDFISNYA